MTALRLRFAPVLLLAVALAFAACSDDDDTPPPDSAVVDARVVDARVSDAMADSSADASPDAFQRAIAKYGYHVQAAWYAMSHQAITGEALSDFVFLCVEKAAPFAVGLYRIDAAALELGKRLARRALRTIAECQARDQWPAYPLQVEPISVPDWMWRAAELEEAAP